MKGEGVLVYIYIEEQKSMVVVWVGDTWWKYT